MRNPDAWSRDREADRLEAQARAAAERDATTPPAPAYATPPQPVVIQYDRPQHAPVRRTRHGLHAALTVLTGGAWGIVWLVRWLNNRGI